MEIQGHRSNPRVCESTQYLGVLLYASLSIFLELVASISIFLGRLVPFET